MSRFSRIASLQICLFAVASLMVGCTTFHYPFEKRIPKATAADPAVQVLCLWQQADGRDPEGYPCKGFSGQVLFLSNKSGTPVQVDGDVRIYLFDDHGTEEEQTKPVRQFDFDSGSWNVHLSETTLGPTYSVFVPYTRRGVKDANCALRVRLKPKKGPVVFSDLSNMPLNGNRKPVRGEEAKPITDEENDQIAAEAMAGSLRRTTTISMGSNPKTTESVTNTRREQPSQKVTPVSAQSATPGNQITQASHQVISEPQRQPSADSERIRQLEAMVQQLLEQKSNPPAELSPTNPPRRTVHPLDLDDERSGATRLSTPVSDRLRLTSRQSADEVATDADDDDNSDEQPVRATRSRHPLDD